MNQQKALLRISELLARFKFQTQLLNYNAQLDINIVSENVMIPILNIIYDCNLENVNYTKTNISFPSLDLVDNEKRIAFQITSTSSLQKVKHTIEGILENNFNNHFDTFYLYIITEKLASYNDEKITEYNKGLFAFTKKNILDSKDLFAKIASLEFHNILKVEKLLNSQFTDIAQDEKYINFQLNNFINIHNSPNFDNTNFEIKSAQEIRNVWIEKRIFFEKKLPVISDVAQEFNLYQQLKEINQNIEDYNSKIVSLQKQIV